MQNKMDFISMVEKKKIDFEKIEHYLGVPNNKDIEMGEASLAVFFSIVPEVKEWGINSMDVTVTKVRGTIFWNVEEEGLSEQEKQYLFNAGGKLFKNGNIEGEITIDTDNKEFQIGDVESNFNKNGSITITGAEIDFTNKKIHITAKN